MPPFSNTLPFSPSLSPAVGEADSAKALFDRTAWRRSERVRYLKLAWASIMLDGVMLALLALAGVDGWLACAITVGVGTLASLAFFVMLRNGWSERFRDPYMTLPQMTMGFALALSVALAAPQIGLLALSVLFVVFAFGALRLRRHQLVAAWAMISIAVVAVFLIKGGELAVPQQTPLQAALSGLWLALVIGRCGFVGLFGAQMRRKLDERNRQLSQVRDKLHQLASRDGLTGALNRRAITQYLQAAMKAGEAPVAVALLDMDHFKAINDRFGHAVGDDVLRRFVARVSPELRASDRLGRYGGEEFLLVLGGMPGADAAQQAMERLRELVEHEPWSDLAVELQATVSIGISIAQDGDDPNSLVARADSALYAAKHAGRNTVRVR